MDGTAVESAFALLLTKVTKPPYPAKISFYTIAGKDTNLCAMSGTGFRKWGDEHDAETNNSGMIGTGSLAHNRREFIAENVDSDRMQLNICYQNENLKEVYKELFDEAVERYNIGKRKDRQITNYYEKIRQGKTGKIVP